MPTESLSGRSAADRVNYETGNLVETVGLAVLAPGRARVARLLPARHASPPV